MSDLMANCPRLTRAELRAEQAQARIRRQAIIAREKLAESRRRNVRKEPVISETLHGNFVVVVKEMVVGFENYEAADKFRIRYISRMNKGQV